MNEAALQASSFISASVSMFESRLGAKRQTLSIEPSKMISKRRWTSSGRRKGGLVEVFHPCLAPFLCDLLKFSPLIWNHFWDSKVGVSVEIWYQHSTGTNTFDTHFTKLQDRFWCFKRLCLFPLLQCSIGILWLTTPGQLLSSCWLLKPPFSLKSIDSGTVKARHFLKRIALAPVSTKPNPT